MPPDSSDQPAPGFGGLAHRIGARNLKIAIVTMPIFFIIAVALIVLIFGKRDEDAAIEGSGAAAISETPSSDASVIDENAPASIMLGAGTAPGALALDGDRLAVRLDGPDGVEVVIYDLAKGEVIARIPFEVSESGANDRE